MKNNERSKHPFLEFVFGGKIVLSTTSAEEYFAVLKGLKNNSIDCLTRIKSCSFGTFENSKIRGNKYIVHVRDWDVRKAQYEIKKIRENLIKSAVYSK